VSEMLAFLLYLTVGSSITAFTLSALDLRARERFWVHVPHQSCCVLHPVVPLHTASILRCRKLAAHAGLRAADGLRKAGAHGGARASSVFDNTSGPGTV
jgi:hypothetical protein